MNEGRKRTSMSVPEMGRLLGLGKTDSYWLVKKHYFKTIQVGRAMRVMVDSFEDWYAHQYTYKKADGTPPGQGYDGVLLSTVDIANILGLSYASAAELIAKGYFEMRDVYGKRRVVKESFDRWYASQSFYMTVDDKAKNADVLESTLSLPDIAHMLGVHRNQIYYLANTGRFEIVQVGRQRRVTIESFEAWYCSQTYYRKLSERGEE